MTRKIFFKLLTISLLLFIGCSEDERLVRNPAPEEPSDIGVEEGMNLVGKLTDGNIPVVGAIVSDGYSVTTTDDEGIYQLKANDLAKFVFVSVPADYEIPTEGGLPKIYRELPADKSQVIRRDFGLKKQAAVSKFQLLALADVQIGQSVELSWLRQNEIPLIADYVNTLKSASPVYGISLGDLVWDNMAYFTEYATEIKRLGLPIFQVIGNHDHDRTVTNNDYLAAQQFERNFGPTYYSYNIGDCHFVVLDNVDYNGHSDYSNYIPENQLDWLKEDLKHVSKDKLIILGTHIYTSRRDRPTLGTSNKQALYDLLEGYKVRILTGHLHNNRMTTINADIEENNLGSVMGAFWNYLCNDGSPRGYAVYEIEGNEIKNWYYKGTDKSKDYQIKIYKPGQAVTLSRQDGVIINIFAWHTNWTVKVYENDVYKATLADNLRFEMDKDAYDAYFGDTKPAHRPSAEPEAYNDHMFYYKPSATTGITIKVEATDSYGNVYVESVGL